MNWIIYHKKNYQITKNDIFNVKKLKFKKIMIDKSFENWTSEDIEESFGMEQVEDLDVLLEWLNTDKVDFNLPEQILKIQKLLQKNALNWNEEELKIGFIVPFLFFIDFNNQPYYKVFSQRLLKINTSKLEVQGRVEWLVASGKITPKKPFFFLHEYKPEKGTGNDPLGQLLIAMCAAQKLNENEDKIIYGTYIMGRNWFFVLLKGKEYSVSRAYDATQTDDLIAMVNILEKVKKYIHQELRIE